MIAAATVARVSPIERHRFIRTAYREFQQRNGGVRADIYIHHEHRGYVLYPRWGIVKKLERHEWDDDMAQAWGDA